MILRTLTTQNFRNLRPEALEFHKEANILVGRNGQGKTNLLEAIYFLATTKSFRTAHLMSMFRFGEASVFAGGAVERDGVERNLSVGFEAAEGRRRALMINGEKVTLSPYLRALTVFAYSSARLEILRGAPEERRRFLDRGIASIDAGYLEQLTRYGRALKQRNALLHAVAAREASASSLDAWDEELIATGTPIQAARAAYARDVAEAFRGIVAEHAYHVERVEIAYRPNDVAAIARLRRDEVRARMSLAGPQRDLLEFTIEGRPAAEVLSGGELKTIVLFLKFAKLAVFRSRFDEQPLFLLDDIDAELDVEILRKLLARLPGRTQVFATSAKEVLLEALEAGPHRRLNIESGRVTAARDFT